MASYRLKRITFHGREVPIVVQNENGPCPLLAIANTLLLRGMLTLPVNSPNVSLERLMQMVAEYLLDSNKVEDESPLAANVQKNLGDVISALPKLATGVDVNPSFNSIRGFEFTDEVAIFDMFNVSLVHGWLVDPAHGNQDLGDFTYNQLVGKLVAILGDETPAHILSTHSSFKSSSRKDIAQTSVKLSVPEEPPLIQLDSEEIPENNVEAAGSLTVPVDDPTPPEKQGNEHLPTPSDIPGTPGSSTDVDNVLNDVLRRVEDHREENASAQVTVPEKDETREHSTIDSQVEENPIIEPTIPSKSNDSMPTGSAVKQKRKNNELSIRAQQWLDETSNQLTHYGLRSLDEGLQDEQLAVFFRNNHFNTIYKRGNGLYLLVTDLGYLSEPGVVWEKLDDVDGDTQMMTDVFMPYVRSDHVESTEQDIDLHRALAASLALDLEPNSEGRNAMDESSPILPDGFLQQSTEQNLPPVHTSDADLALALQLHEEELQRHEAMLQEAALDAEQQQQSAQPTSAEHAQPTRHRPPQAAMNRPNRSQRPHYQNREQVTEPREPSGFQKFSQSLRQLFTPKK